MSDAGSLTRLFELEEASLEPPPEAGAEAPAAGWRKRVIRWWRSVLAGAGKGDGEALRAPAGAEAAKASTAAPPGGEPAAPKPPRWRVDPPPRDLVGLALSGGGIRSATFNLGLLQRLARLRILGRFDLLATVSGGGYLGGFWSAWRTRPNGEARNGAFPAGEVGREAPEVRHLREFSNFLRPRVQLFSFETGRLVAAVAVALVPSIVAASAVIVLALSVWWAVARLLLGGRLEQGPAAPAPAALALVGSTLAVQALLEWLWRRRPEEPASRAVPTYWLLAAAAALLAGAAGWVLWQLAPAPAASLVGPAPAAGAGVRLAAFAAPVAAWLAVALVLVVGRTAASRFRGFPARCRLGALDRVLSRLVLTAAVWAAVAALWVAGQVLAAEGIAGLLAAAGAAGAGGGAFAWVRRLLGAVPARATSGERGPRSKLVLLSVLAYLTLAVAVAGAAGLLAKVGGAWGSGGLVTAGWISAAAIVAACVLFDPHEMGFHAFYRARLVRAYLGAANRDAPSSATAECTGDDLPLPDLAPGRPLHLLCCAANDLEGDPLTTLHRGAESAVLSRLGVQIGERWRPWTEPGVAPHRVPTLGGVMTASGAAFNSHMGGRSMVVGQAATFLLTALSLRLGLWLEGVPRRAVGWGRLVLRRLPGLLFFRELLSLSKSDSPWVFLSDGAHFDNLGLYELVRRHCRFILASDCGADSEVAFDDLADAIRRVREDFQVEIDLDVRPLRPDEHRRARQPMVAGEIRYPGGDVGILLFVKPTLTGGEPSDVTQYAVRNRAFPHETTLDQFYDEAQWESYRRLGEHVADEAFGHLEPVVEARRSQGEVDVARLFGAARSAWRPPPPEDPAAVGRFRREWAQLETRLWGARDAAALRAEVYPPGDGPPLTAHPAGGGSVAAHPADAAAAAALPYVRHAARLMEAALLTTGLAADPSHPRYLGWMNLFGRWATAPLFRLWWPWLAPLHAAPFVAFVTARFDLPPAASETSIEVQRLTDRTREGYAWTRWRRGRTKRATAGRLFGCLLRHDGRPFQAGLVELRRAHDRSEWAWYGEDFFVAPGLWGVRIGELFLRRLMTTLKRRGVSRLTVCCPRGPSPSDVALYPAAGFRWQRWRGPGAEGSKAVRFVRDL